VCGRRLLRGFHRWWRCGVCSVGRCLRKRHYRHVLGECLWQLRRGWQPMLLERPLHCREHHVQHEHRQLCLVRWSRPSLLRRWPRGWRNLLVGKRVSGRGHGCWRRCDLYVRRVWSFGTAVLRHRRSRRPHLQQRSELRRSRQRRGGHRDLSVRAGRHATAQCKALGRRGRLRAPAPPLRSRAVPCDSPRLRQSGPRTQTTIPNTTP